MERAASFPLAETAHRPGTMLLCISALLLIGVRRVGGDTSAVTQPNIQSELQCVDWGVSAPGTVRVLEGEAGWLRCPLFSHPTLYSYSSAQSSGLSLVWYRVGAGQVLEQPINLKLPSYHKDREWLWIQPAEARDAGQYICMLRNISSCVKIALHLEVVPRNGQGECVMVAAVPTQNISIPIEHHHTITCPDLQNTTLPNSTYSVTWYHHCRRDEFRGILHREIKGASLIIYTMYEIFTGPYTCVVSYHSNGRTLNFTRVVNVSAVSSPKLPKEPKIFTPYEGQVFTVKLGEEVVLTCTASLPHLNNEQQQLWWTVDGKTTEQLSNPRFTTSLWLVTEHFGDQVKGVELRVQEFSQEDLQRQYNCSVQNSRGFETRVARLEKEKYVPSLELGCGLGVTLFLMLMMFVVYHVFWLELLLLYRSWFGSDERLTDDKEYDVYISYARNSEEEQFVLLTLRRVLENELGYTVCIFDRDSLPGGTITDETLSFVGLSRRLIVVISPSSMLQGTQALLELKAGLDSMVWGGHLRVILVQYQPVQRASWVRELKRARIALALIRWKGEESSSLSSRFWKRLQVELPIRRLRELQSGDNGEAIPLKGKAASDIQKRLHTNEDGKTHTTQSS